MKVAVWLGIVCLGLQCWCQIWPRKSGIHVHNMCGKLGSNRAKSVFFFKILTFCPTMMTLTLAKFEVDEMNPQGQFQGQPTFSYQVWSNWAQGRKRYANLTFDPNDLDFCWNNKPLHDNFRASLHTLTKFVENRANLWDMPIWPQRPWPLPFDLWPQRPLPKRTTDHRRIVQHSFDMPNIYRCMENRPWRWMWNEEAFVFGIIYLQCYVLYIEPIRNMRLPYIIM
jgi:hypothetical protein